MNASLAANASASDRPIRSVRAALVRPSQTRHHFRIIPAAAILGASAASATVIAYGSRVPALVQFAVILGTWLLALAAVIVLQWREQSRVASAISQLMIEAQEQERARIARELHDDIGQRVSLLTIALAGESRELQEQAAEIAADVQSLSRELHNSHVELLGLGGSIRAFCRAFAKRRNATVHCDIHDLPRDLIPQICVSLFRVLQEALHNAAKHSGVSLFSVEVSASNGEVRLRVRDRGQGFDLERARTHPGLGLKSIEERMRLVGGHCSIETRAGTGTSVEAVVPITGRGRRAHVFREHNLRIRWLSRAVERLPRGSHSGTRIWQGAHDVAAADVAESHRRRDHCADQAGRVDAAADSSPTSSRNSVESVAGENLERHMSEQRSESPKAEPGDVLAGDGEILKVAVLERIRAEFVEMPGLHLTVRQAVRLCGVQPALCQAVFAELVDRNFLCCKASGVYARVTDADCAHRRSRVSHPFSTTNGRRLG